MRIRQSHFRTAIAIILVFIPTVHGSSFNNDDYTNDDKGIFEASRKSMWLYDATAMAIEYNGCTWGLTDSTDDAGCLGASSEDGLTSWYLMSNCRRTQAVYSVYSVSDSNSLSCSKNTYKGTFISTNGIYGFLSTLQGYDEYPLYSDDDDYFNEGNFPMCEEDQNGYYTSVGCSESGDLTIDQFSDKYCLQYVSTFKTLSTATNRINNYKNCHQAYSSRNGNSPEYSAIAYLLAYSETCNQLDTPYCYDIDGTKTKSLKQTSDGAFKNIKHYAGQSVASKMKYVLGCFFVISSFVMFIGILFTNRRKRRAMLRRHFRKKSMDRRQRGRAGRSEGHRVRKSRSGRGSKSREREKEEPMLNDGGDEENTGDEDDGAIGGTFA